MQRPTEQAGVARERVNLQFWRSQPFKPNPQENPMKRQGRELSRDMQGEDVKLLQTELRQLNRFIRDDEFNQSFFGETTQQAVFDIQKLDNLPASSSKAKFVRQMVGYLLVQRFEPSTKLICSPSSPIIQNLSSERQSSILTWKTTPP
ncbi:peptidoglycan-binding domain-containing protein [Leptolyngbya sp. 7M]|uniref:peptidoglycan-binding domain-containing protein n=1 Tax=Leptolyngbya sp. 7M TaxID=2812896 RepID=UPI001B8BA28F|nr:hypothetical protein [Leptolyngbya sp. 7M]QYO67820.1 hypothetical protein JVX88_14160 [Leptolyngbya sp. 7M]